MPSSEGSSHFGSHVSREALDGAPKPIELTSGYLPFEVPHVMRQATAEATLHPDLAAQTSGEGLYELRAAAANKFDREYGVTYTPDQVLVTNGSSGALRVVLSRFNGLGESGNGPSPKLWTPEVGYDYQKIARYSGIADVGRYPLVNGLPDVEQIIELFKKTDGPNIFLLNSPANPTGKIVPDEVMGQLAEVFGEEDVVVEDNVFAGMTYDGVNHASIAPHLPDQTIVIDSTSKQGANWQVGWLMAPAHLYADLLEVREATGGVFPPAQYGAAKLLDGTCDDYQAKIKKEMQERRDLMHQELTRIPGFEDIEKPEGGFFYFLPGLPNAEVLKAQYGVSITEGKKYGMEPYKRISFAASRENIVEGVARIGRAIAER